MADQMQTEVTEYIKNQCNKVITYVKGKEFISNVLFILFLIFIRLVVLGNYSVPTGSMKPTILEGDKFFSNKLAYSVMIPFTKIHPLRWAYPKRGDIIAFKNPENEKVDFTKRVIGLPGDKIIVEDRTLIINGKEIVKQVIREEADFTFYQEDLLGVEHIIQHAEYSSFPRKEWVVPPNHLFVLGDNRDNSHDSRYWGFVPIENVTGKLILRWMSNKPGQPWVLRLNRIGLIE